MSRSWSRRRAVSAVVVGLVAGLSILTAGAPPPAAASCGKVLDFEATARLPGVSFFTGRALREDDGFRVAFSVERWLRGSHPARLVHFQESAAFLVEPPAAGTISAVLARVVSGDAAALERGQLVLVAAVGSERAGYAPVVCGIGVVPLDSAEGRASMAKATAMFGPGLRVAQIPATTTAAGILAASVPTAPWLPTAAFAAGLAGALLLGRRRSRRP